MRSLRFPLRSLRLCVESHSSLAIASNLRKLTPSPPTTWPIRISDCPSPLAIAQIGRNSHDEPQETHFRQTASGQPSQRRPIHRTPLPRGQIRSAQNARKHGFTASTFAVVRLEDLDEVARLRQDAIAVYQPVNSQELFAVERIALAQQTLLRVERLHTGLCTTFLNEALDGNGRPLMGICKALVNDDNEITQAQNRNYLFAEGFHRLHKYSNSFTLFLRYQAQTERLYRRAIEEFNRLKALRHELPNEPILDTQPEANETVNPPESNPGNPPKPSPAGNIPGQPKRFHPNGEPDRVFPQPDPDSDPPQAEK